MKNGEIFINVRLDEKQFRAFAIFDTFIRRRLWQRMALFAGILGACGIACFFFGRPGILLGVVLLCIGLGLPAIYAGTFMKSVGKEAALYHLAGGRPVYTVELCEKPEGVSVQSGSTPKVRYTWAECHGAWRKQGITYLYTSENHALLLPDGQVRGGTEKLWALLRQMLPAEKLHEQ